MFSYPIGDIPEDDATSSAQSAEASENIKTKLREILNLLSQDIGQLVQDAEPIRQSFKALQNQIPESVEEALIPAAFIESHQFEVLKAKKRLADRSKQEQVSQETEKLKAQADKIKEQIGVLNRSQEDLEEGIRKMKAKCEALLKEVREIDQAIASDEALLKPIPASIQKLEDEKLKYSRQAYRLHRSIQPIPGSADADRQIIENVNQIRLRAVDAIQHFLGPV
jgi:chromosome segregation ATPase